MIQNTKKIYMLAFSIRQNNFLRDEVLKQTEICHLGCSKIASIFENISKLIHYKLNKIFICFS